MKITVLTGGAGATLLPAVKTHLGWDPAGPRPSGISDEITAIVAVSSDIRLHNLQICPDLDRCLYVAAGIADIPRGRGRAGDTFAAWAELTNYGAEAPWFPLGDKDIATHLMRTRMLDAGFPLSSVTDALCAQWQPGVRLLPVSDDRIETHVVVADPDAAGDDRPLAAIHVQEWRTRYRGELPALSMTPIGADGATPAPGVVTAITEADIVLIAPADPVTDIGVMLAVPGIRDALTAAPGPVIGISPLDDGSDAAGSAPIRAALATTGDEASAQGIASWYGARSAGGLLDGFIAAPGDEVAVPGLAIGAAPLPIADSGSGAEVARAAIDLAATIRSRGRHDPGPA